MISTAADYEEVDVSNVAVTGAIFPLRYATGAIGKANHGACVMRAEDVAFIFEAKLERARACDAPAYSSLKDVIGKVDLRTTYSQYTSLRASSPLQMTVGWIDPDLDVDTIPWPQNLYDYDEAMAWLLESYEVQTSLTDELLSRYPSWIFYYLPIACLYYDIMRAIRAVDSNNLFHFIRLAGTAVTRELYEGEWQTTTSPMHWDDSSRPAWTYTASAHDGQLDYEYYHNVTLSPNISADALRHMSVAHLFLVASRRAVASNESRVFHRTIAVNQPVAFGREDSVAIAADFGFPARSDDIYLDISAFMMFDFAFPAEINSLDWSWTPEKQERGDYDGE